MKIIGLVGVRKHRVGQCGVDRRGADVGGDDGRFGNPALRPRIPDRHLAGLEVRTRHHCCNRVQDAWRASRATSATRVRVRASTM